MKSRFAPELVCLAMAVASCALSPRGAFAHKFHESLARLEYNQQSRAVEMTFRLFADDLEASLTRRAGRPIRIDKNKDAGPLTLDYLREAFELKNRDGQPKPFRWVGMEIKVDVVWVYLEADMPEGIEQAQVRNRIFFDLFDDQVNRVNIVAPGSKGFLVFKPGDQFKTFAGPGDRG